jgi:hypothetical protein
VEEQAPEQAKPKRKWGEWTKEERLANLAKAQAVQAERRRLGISKPTGAPPKRLSRHEAYKLELRQIVPVALRVLTDQLYSKDERIRQRAAIEVLDRAQGRPAQEVKPPELKDEVVYHSSVLEALESGNPVAEPASEN